MANVIAHQMIRVIRGFEIWTVERVVFPHLTGWWYSSKYIHCLSGRSNGYFPRADLRLPDGTPDDIAAQIHQQIADYAWVTL